MESGGGTPNRRAEQVNLALLVARRRHEAMDETMAIINESAIQKRARELAERDGFTWQLDYNPERPGTKVAVQSYLSPERRQHYLDRAVAELREEAENC
jgi:hypothetical protein